MTTAHEAKIHYPTMHEVNSTAVWSKVTYDYCHECGRLFYVRNSTKCAECVAHDARIQREAFTKSRTKRTPTALIAALALALIPLTTHAMPAYPDSLTPPPLGCVVTHWTPDDYSAMAVCAGGYLVTKEDGPRGIWDDIPYAVGTTRVGPDTNGRYWDWPIWD